VTLTLLGTSLVATPNIVNISVPAGQKSALQMQAGTVSPSGFTATLAPLDSFLLLSPSTGILTLPQAFGVGIDATSLSPGTYTSSIAVQCSTCFDTAVSVNATVTAPTGPGTPAITPNGIVPLYSTATTVGPGEWISIFGTNLSNGTYNWQGDFPQSLGGTTVKINGKNGYLSYVSPTQINVEAPDDSATGSVPVQLISPNGSTSSSVTLSELAPALSLLGDNKHAAGLIIRTDNSGAYSYPGGTYDIIGPTGSSLGYRTVAAKAGDHISLYGVGFGTTTP
jgi:uncharacterized protein (TIGR03437 family)